MEQILAQEEEHPNDMHDLLVTHEGRPMLEKRGNLKGNRHEYENRRHSEGE